jgi:hypothetical protein
MSPSTQAGVANHSHRFPRKRILPTGEERRVVTLFVNAALDANLDIFSRLMNRAKNDLVHDILDEFLANERNCDAAHERSFPSPARVRVTFIVPKGIHDKLDIFVRNTGCQQTCAVTAALIKFLQNKDIDPYLDVRSWMLEEWQKKNRTSSVERPLADPAAPQPEEDVPLPQLHFASEAVARLNANG